MALIHTKMSSVVKLNINSTTTVADFKIVLLRPAPTTTSQPPQSALFSLPVVVVPCQAQGRSNAGKFMILIRIDFPDSTPPLPALHCLGW